MVWPSRTHFIEGRDGTFRQEITAMTCWLLPKGGKIIAWYRLIRKQLYPFARGEWSAKVAEVRHKARLNATAVQTVESNHLMEAGEKNGLINAQPLNCRVTSCLICLNSILRAGATVRVAGWELKADVTNAMALSPDIIREKK
jgi:hypothetical protein